MILAKKERWVNFSGEINVGTVGMLEDAISGLVGKDPEEPITLFIASEGGSFIAGIAFYEFIKRVLKPNLQTVALGEVGSAAVIMFIAGEARIITKESSIFLHEVGRVFGDERVDKSEVGFFERELGNAQRKYARIVAECSGGKISAQGAEKLMLAKTTLTARRAVKFGIAHEILK